MHSINPNNNRPDVEYRHHIFGSGFLAPVEGVDYLWSEQELVFTIQQSIDAALDARRLDVVKQLAKHL